MLVSVIITTKNEERNIERCLQSVLNQQYLKENIEIIVVDNNSTDKTQEIAGKYTAYVFNKGPERCAQRNFGINMSRGDYFLYLDADMILSENVLAECAQKVVEHPETAGLYIPEIIMGDSLFCKIRRFERSFYNATVIDAVRFIKKEAFRCVGGFDETLISGEDWDFDKRIRHFGKTAIINSPLYHNESEIHLKQYINKKSYYADKINAYTKKWGAADPDLKKQFGMYYRFLGVFIENQKWKKLIANPFITIGMYALRALVGVKFLLR
ncbi:MAG: glycosyltransferase [Nitrospirae bacterium YQR-1]